MLSLNVKQKIVFQLKKTQQNNKRGNCDPYQSCLYRVKRMVVSSAAQRGEYIQYKIIETDT